MATASQQNLFGGLLAEPPSANRDGLASGLRAARVASRHSAGAFSRPHELGDGAGCDSASCDPTFELGKSLLDQPRTLIVSQRGQSVWGMGNLLPILQAYHTLCFAFRRKCIVQMMNTGLEKFYRYQDGRLWWQRRNITTKIDTALSAKGGALVKALQEHNSSTVIKVSLKHMPDFALVSVVSHLWGNRSSTRRVQLDVPTSVRRPCILRWFTEPAQAQPRPKAEFNRALHLRTDWADLTDKQRSYGVYNRTVSKRWLLQACPNLTSWTEDDLVVSDSPGILKSARALGVQVGSAVTLQGRTHSALMHGQVGNTKGATLQNTTDEVITSSITDLNWLMHARVVYSGGSSFTSGAQLGSLCTDFRSLKEVCPYYDSVFPREFHKILPPAGRNHAMYAGIAKDVDAPCYDVSAVSCLQQYVQAVSSQEAD